MCFLNEKYSVWLLAEEAKGITGKPIKVLANGKVYKSIREAERQLKINRTVIAYEMRRPDGWIKRA